MKVIVDRTRWYRGQGGDASRLQRQSDGRKCCLGFACLSAGFIEKEILDIGTPEEIADGNSDLMKRFCSLEHVESSNFWKNQLVVTKMVNVNDLIGIDDESREAQLIALGAQIDIQFEFIN